MISPFSLKWYLSLLFTGINIGCASSVKWVGLFVTALVGLHTIVDLWNLLGDLSLTRRQFVRHLSARILFLIFIPLSVYTSSFYLHFHILNRSGPGDGTMNSLFQAGLIGNPISSSSLNVAYGSKVNLRNGAIGGGLLHSHHDVYPSGSKQQQVTGYHHRDSNNDWIVKPGHLVQLNDNVTFVKHGSVIRLVHLSTLKNLHSHPVLAPVTKSDFEVSGYGNDTVFVDPNDHWIVEIVNEKMTNLDKENVDIVHALHTEFTLKHAVLGCYLSSTKGIYPQWGFSQVEVSCQKTFSNSRNLIWNVEYNQHDLLPPGQASLYKSNFLDNFIECNFHMWRTNNALISDPELEPAAIISTASQWPFLSVGLRMVGWDERNTRFLMLGNPLIWWGGTYSLIILTICIAFIVLYYQRTGLAYTDNTKWFLQQCQICVLGWLFHYLPFLIMGRVLYLHHYYPSLYFSILGLGVLVDCILSNVQELCKKLNLKISPSIFKWSLMICISVPIIYTFYLFMPTCYGMTGPVNNYKHLAWVSSWNIY